MDKNILERARKLSVLCVIAIVLFAILYLMPPFISSVSGTAFSYPGIIDSSLSGIIVALFLIFTIASSIWFFGAFRSEKLGTISLFLLCLVMPWFVIILIIATAIEFFCAYRAAENNS